MGVKKGCLQSLNKLSKMSIKGRTDHLPEAEMPLRRKSVKRVIVILFYHSTFNAKWCEGLSDRRRNAAIEC